MSVTPSMISSRILEERSRMQRSWVSSTCWQASMLSMSMFMLLSMLISRSVVNVSLIVDVSSWSVNDGGASDGMLLPTTIIQ